MLAANNLVQCPIRISGQDIPVRTTQPTFSSKIPSAKFRKHHGLNVRFVYFLVDIMVPGHFGPIPFRPGTPRPIFQSGTPRPTLVGPLAPFIFFHCFGDLLFLLCLCASKQKLTLIFRQGNWEMI